MATKAQKIKVGVFLILNVAVLTGGLALMSGYRHANEVAYDIIFPESVLGLYEGGLVQYQGVEVGRVGTIHVGPDHRAHVRILVNPGKVRLKEGTKAKLEIFSLATGTMCVALFDGDPNGADLDPAHPILAEPSFVESLGTELAGLTDDLESIIQQIKVGLEGMEEGELADTVTNAKDAINSFKEGLNGMEEGAVSDTVSEIRNVVDKIDQGLNGMEEGGLADTVTGVKDIVEKVDTGLTGVEEGDLAEIVRNARDITAQIKKGFHGIEEGELTRVVRKVEELVDDMQEFVDTATTTVDQTTRATMYTAENMQYSLAETLAALHEAVEAIRDLAVYLQEDPSALVRGKGKPQGDK